MEAERVPSDEILDDIHGQLDDYFEARFAEPVPGSQPITYPPPAPVDVEALDRYLAELVHGGARR